MNVEMLDKEVFEPEEEVKYECERCQDTGFVEEMGDGENFEWDVIGHSRCSCNED